MSREPSVKLIAETAAEYYGVGYRDILSARRAPELVRARHVAMALACKLTRLSTTAIGRQLGKDHSSVINGRDRAAALSARDDDLAGDIAAIETAVAAVMTASDIIQVTPPADLDATAIAARVLASPRAVTTIAIDELVALATAVAAGPPAGAADPADASAALFDAAGALLAALAAFDAASFADRGAITAARKRLAAARLGLATLLNGPTHKENGHERSSNAARP